MLDERLDRLRSDFADNAVALEYDATQLLERYDREKKQTQLLDSQPLPCLGPRAHWMDCQKKQGNFSACDGYLQTLQACVKEEIVRSSSVSTPE